MLGSMSSGDVHRFRLMPGAGTRSVCETTLLNRALPYPAISDSRPPKIAQPTLRPALGHKLCSSARMGPARKLFQIVGT